MFDHLLAIPFLLRQTFRYLRFETSEKGRSNGRGEDLK
jgi:hypothetical protein